MDGLVNKPTPDDDKVHLMDYLIVLAKHSRMIIYSSAAMVVLIYLILFILPNRYTATAQLLPPQQNLTLSAQLMDSLGFGTTPGSSGGGTGLGGMAANLLGFKSPGDLYVGMLTSNTIFDGIIERFNLREHYRKKYIEDVRETLSWKAKFSADKSGLITIEVTDEDPQRSAEMANAFVEELDKLLQKLAREEARTFLAFLEKERTQASLHLAKAEEAFRAFSEQSNVIQIDTQTKGVLQYIAELRAKIDAKEVELRVLRQQATPFNYQVINLETELKALKEKLRAAETEAGQAHISDVSIVTSKVPALGLEYVRLYREVKFQEVLYHLYARMVEIARLDMIRDIAVVQSLGQAIPPEKRSNKRLFPALLAGTATFFIMIFVAFILEYLQNVKNREDSAQRLSVLMTYLQPYRHAITRLKNKVNLKKGFKK